MAAIILTIALLIPAAGEIMPDVDEIIYKITFDGETRYGAIRDNGNQIDIVWDTPWAPQRPYRTLPSNVQSEEEPRALRKDRRREQAEAAGYKFHENQWMSKGAWYALRAREMDRAREQAQPAVDVALVEDPPPGFLAQWWLHAVILAAGLGLTGFVLKGMRGD